MCYFVSGMVHIKDSLLLIRRSSPCSGDNRFPLSLSEWSFTILCPTPYNRKIKYFESVNVLSVSLSKTSCSFAHERSK